MFAARVTALPEGTRRLLLLMALDGTGDPRVLRADGSSQHFDDLAAAERARLAYVDHVTRRLAFRHPLIRSAVVELSTEDECRRAHEQLAGLLADQPDRQAWHLAEATMAPDEHVAGLLEQVAQRILARGDATGAVAALTRASELSPQRACRSRRSAKAAYIGATVAGELDTASQLLDDARRADPDPGGSLEAAIAASYLLLNGDGNVDTAHRLLVGAIENRAAVDPDRATACWRKHCTPCSGCAGSADEPNCGNPSTPCSPGSPRTSRRRWTWRARSSPIPVRMAGLALKKLDAAIADLTDEIDPVRIMRIANSCGFVDRYGPCRDALWRVVRDGREGRAVGSAITGLILLGFDHFRTGRWDQALQLTDEALKPSEPHGYRILGAQLNLAVIAACSACAISSESGRRSRPHQNR